MKAKSIKFVCQSCQAEYVQWAGQCVKCHAWNCIESIKASSTKITVSTKPQKLATIDLAKCPRMPTDLGELDRVLGGGLVPGGVVLLGGDPGVGKSTLLLQALGSLAKNYKILYVTGEESLSQVANRAVRLDINLEITWAMSETDCEKIFMSASQHNAEILVLDSVQTLSVADVASAPGSVSQVRAVTHACVQYAKKTNTAIFLIGHVTKDGAIAGPRMLEHMVDTVLYFEGEKDRTYRVVRAVKNRYGAVNEMGIFAMLDKGLKPVNHPSAIFISHTNQSTPGRVIMATWEGTRPLLVEVQALVDVSQSPQPRRVAVGLDNQRVAMLLAILHKHVGISTAGMDIFINIVGGLKITEPAADLAVLVAIVSSLKNKVVSQDAVVFGEVGLGGELRPVPSGQPRVVTAKQHGFNNAYLPKANNVKNIKDVVLHSCVNLEQILDKLF